MTSEQFWFNVGNVVAVLLSPLIAVQLTLWLQRRRETQERKLAIFKTLMRTRASGLAPEHVQALNLLNIEFYGKDKASKEVLAAWQAYLDQLNTPPNESAPANWVSRREELFIELLYTMAKYLGYKLDRTEIRRTAYLPVGYGNVEDELKRIRTGLADMVEGKKALPIWVISVPPNPVPPGPKTSNP